MRGLVTLLEANRPTVQADDGSVYLCYLKGRIKRDVGRVMVGDWVELEPTDPGEARIVAIQPRVNTLVRPPVANVSGLFVIFTLAHPKGSLELLDKRLVAARLMGLDAELVLAKIDLADEPAIETVDHAYQAAGYRVWRVSSVEQVGLNPLISQERRGVWVLTGESGAGKSTLLNVIIPRAPAPTQSLSRIGRGQQTTRWVRLYPFRGYWLADSPGYTALQAAAPSPQAIERAFDEFRAFTCRFKDCLHGQEPGCGVVEAVSEARVAHWRYHHYRKLLIDWVKTYETKRR